ncbi:SNF5-domain-containing protein [Microthyrium microscopicum]|uniref:SNF5-domain-containing protein n=1 Tax=Microthyrium microscopicum TaxID=703497 RepID=A0A6A6UFM2_9PEZI|nr:SNF5-domain-containing protein [Microthyrium microscopicum]
MASTESPNNASTTAAGQAHPDMNGDISSRSNSIQESKDKAKAVLAASGIDVDSQKDSTKSPEKVSDAEKSSENNNANGQVAIEPRVKDGKYAVENEVDRFRLLTFQQNDADFNTSLVDSHLPWHRSVVTQKTRQLHLLNTEIRQIRVENPALIYGTGYLGYGNVATNIPRHPNQPPNAPRYNLIYPFQRPRRRRAPRPHASRKDMLEQAELGEELVPIRLDIEHDRIKLRDTFTWNLQDRLINADVFAQALIEDFMIPNEVAGVMSQQVAIKMKEQLLDYYPQVFINNSSIDEQLSYQAYKNDEMRILVKLHITIGVHTLIDQFEWEINNPMNNPEEFARAMARDLSLSGEFTTAIAHQIREQSQKYTKGLYITQHAFDGRPLDDPNNKSEMADYFLTSPLPSVYRSQNLAKEYTPYLYELSEADLQRDELSILRDQRRQKRSVTRRGGPALPDLKDQDRTIRSLVISSTLPGAADKLENARVFKLSRSSGRGRKAGRVDDGDDSDDSGSDDSEMEVDQTPQVIQTSRGRIIRGAAHNATAAIKANLGRSQTPELSQLHHEPKSISRRPVYELRDDSASEPPQTLIVKLKVAKDILRQFKQNPKLRLDRLRASGGPSRGNTPHRRASNTPIMANKALGASPAVSTASKAEGPWSYDEKGRVTLSQYPQPGQEPPPIPGWLEIEVKNVREQYPHDAFEAFMKLTGYDKSDPAASVLLKPEQLISDKPKPSHITLQWQPRVKCLDCPGRAYNTGEGQTLRNFEVHLKNRKHKEIVEVRRKNER